VAVPAFFVFMKNKEVVTVFVGLGCLFYLFAGMKRLLRYTVSKIKTNSQNSSFIGCPVTAVALCVVLAANIYQNIFIHVILLFVCGYFMISRIKYIPFSTMLSEYGRDISVFINIVFLTPFLIFYCRNTIFAISCVYLLFFPLQHLWSKYGKGFDYTTVRIFALAKGARHIIVVGVICTIMSILLLPVWLKPFYIILFFSLIFFFRDPERYPGQIGGSDIVAPADGKIIGIAREFNTINGKFMNKISIFLSIFDVHVTRAPIQSCVLECRYFEGRHLDARHPEAGNNENFLYTLDLESGTKIYLKQIAGKFARRIKSYVRERDFINTSDRMGIILFGSRVELLVPDESSLYIKIGDTVKAGITVIGKLG